MSNYRYRRPRATNSDKILFGILYGVIALALIAGLVFGALAIIGHLQPFEVIYNDAAVTAPISGISIGANAPLVLGVSRDCDVKITTNQTIGFKLDGVSSELAQGTDITRGFTITQEDGTLTIASAASLDEMLIALFPGQTVSDVSAVAADTDLFTATLTQGDTVYTIGFRFASTDVTGLTVEGMIEF